MGHPEPYYYQKIYRYYDTKHSILMYFDSSITIILYLTFVSLCIFGTTCPIMLWGMQTSYCKIRQKWADRRLSRLPNPDNIQKRIKWQIKLRAPKGTFAPVFIVAAILFLAGPYTNCIHTPQGEVVAIKLRLHMLCVWSESQQSCSRIWRWWMQGWEVNKGALG